MSLERIKGVFVFICNDCDDTLETLEIDFGEALQEMNFSEALQEMKAKGWKAYKDHNDEWAHSCPDCHDGSAFEDLDE